MQELWPLSRSVPDRLIPHPNVLLHLAELRCEVETFFPGNHKACMVKRSNERARTDDEKTCLVLFCPLSSG